MKVINYKYYIIIAFIISIASSCTKVIDLKLGDSSGQLVIEANITNSRSSDQVVKLSRNVPFTNTDVYPPVTGATVKMHDNFGNNYDFTEQAAGIYAINHVVGISGATYTLNVSVDGGDYTAKSTMPQRVLMDSISTSNQEGLNNTQEKKIVTVHFLDPPNIANQYRFVLSVNQIPVNDVFAFNDAFSDGRYVHLDLREDNVDIIPGDVISVEMQCIDQPIYNYWFTLLEQEDTTPGAEVTPSNPPTNITPATLGYFSAHTTQTITQVVR